MNVLPVKGVPDPSKEIVRRRGLGKKNLAAIAAGNVTANLSVLNIPNSVATNSAGVYEGMPAHENFVVPDRFVRKYKPHKQSTITKL